MTKMLIIFVTLWKIAKKLATHPISIWEPDIDFQNLVDKLEQAKITKKSEETEKVKLQYLKKTFKPQLHLLLKSKTLKTN